MKTISILSVMVFGVSLLAWPGRSPAESAGALEGYRKNLARHHLGATLLAFNPARGSYDPTEAAAAWLDDDVATGWPAAPGKAHYLVALAEPSLAVSFAISARGTSGTLSLYASDEALPPGDPGWVSLAKGVGIETINNAKLPGRFNRLAKFFLIETDTAEAGPIYSIYLFGEKPAVHYSLWKRDTAADPASALGGFVNESTGINLAGLYAGSRVIGSGDDGAEAPYQTAIDDDPESSLTLPASEAGRSLAVRFPEPHAVQRVSVQTREPARGTLELFVEPTGDFSSSAEPAGKVASIRLDGTSDRSLAEFPPASGAALSVRWIPDQPGEPLVLREVNTFGDVTPSGYALSNPEAIGEGGELLSDRSKGDGKSSGKEALPPIAEGPGDLKSPYLPGPYNPPPEFPLSPR
jgi:hypothetical protein